MINILEFSVFDFSSINPEYLVKCKNQENLNMAQILWKSITDQNIKKVFGVPGLAVYKLLYNIPENIEWYNIGNELSDGFCAQIYGQYMNEAGILFVTSGPGFATAFSTLKNAIQEHNPLVVISGYVKTDSFYDFQKIDFNGLADIIPYTFVISDPSLTYITFKTAYEIAKTKNTGVLIEIKIDTELISPKYIYYEPPKTICEIKREKQIEKNIKCQIKNLLNNKKNTLVIIGKGNYENINKVYQFIKRNNLPYITTWKGRCVINGGINCGRVGTLGYHSANYALYHAKNVLIVGNLSGGLTDSSNFYTTKFSSGILQNKQNIVSISLYKETIEKLVDHYFVVNNIENILEGLHISTNNKWKEFLINSNNKLYTPLKRISKLEDYIYNAYLVYDKLSIKPNVVTDNGNHWLAAGKYFNIKELNTWDSSTTWASIGIGPPNAYGMTLAKPNKQIWLFNGDGGATFSLNVITYLIHQQLLGNNFPITISLFVDKYYSAIVSGYEINDFIPNKKTIITKNYMNPMRTPKINWDLVIPQNMRVTLHSPEDYYNYLSNNPFTDKLRFILLTTEFYNESNVYEINYNKEYRCFLKYSEFNKILNYPLVLKAELN